MRKSFITAVLVSASFLSFGQDNIQRDSTGNFYSEARSRVTLEPRKTAYIYRNSKGELYPVYESESGRYFILMTSKRSGKTYRKYLTK